MNLLLQFTESLRSIMLENNITPEKLALDLKHNVFDIYHWSSCKCKYMPSVANLIKLADYFHCSLTFLLGMEEINSLVCPKAAADFTKRFPSIVKEKGFSLYKLAKATNMNNVSYYDWINGKAFPRIDSLIKVAAALECSIDYLIGRDY